MSTIRELFLIAVPHIETDDDRDKLAAALGVKLQNLREKVLPSETMPSIRLSAKKFKTVLRDYERSLAVVSAYGTWSRKRTVGQWFLKSSVVSTVLIVNGS